MKKNFIVSLSVLLGSVALASGCNYSSKPMTILYQKPAEASGDATVTPTDARTHVEGTTGSAGSDEAITPARDDSGSSDDASSTPAATPPSEPVVTPPAATVEGDGVADDPVEVGTPPPTNPIVVAPLNPGILRQPSILPGGAIFRGTLQMPTVSCDVPSFAFVSNRGGFSDIFTSKNANVQKFTANDRSDRFYRHLSFKPGSQLLATDNTTDPMGGVELVDLSLEAPIFTNLDAGSGMPSSLAWNRDGTKIAYQTVVRFDEASRLFVSAIMINPSYGFTVGGLTVTTNAADPTQRFGKIAWWGDKLIFSMTGGVTGDDRLYVVDTTRSPYRVELLGIWGSDPSVSPDGTKLAYTENNCTLVTCDLAAASDGTDSCGGRNLVTPISDTMGKNTQPTWSPDGRWIYFTAEKPSHWGNKEIYRVHPDGTNEERLTNDPADDASPAPFAPYATCN